MVSLSLPSCGGWGRKKSAFVSASLWALSLLLLGNSTSAAAKSAADYYVRSLPGAPEPLLKMHAGYVPLICALPMIPYRSGPES